MKNRLCSIITDNNRVILEYNVSRSRLMSINVLILGYQFHLLQQRCQPVSVSFAVCIVFATRYFFSIITKYNFAMRYLDSGT